MTSLGRSCRERAAGSWAGVGSPPLVIWSSVHPPTLCTGEELQREGFPRRFHAERRRSPDPSSFRIGTLTALFQVRKSGEALPGCSPFACSPGNRLSDAQGSPCFEAASPTTGSDSDEQERTQRTGITGATFQEALESGRCPTLRLLWLTPYQKREQAPPPRFSRSDSKRLEATTTTGSQRP